MDNPPAMNKQRLLEFLSCSIVDAGDTKRQLRYSRLKYPSYLRPAPEQGKRFFPFDAEFLQPLLASTLTGAQCEANRVAGCRYSSPAGERRDRDGTQRWTKPHDRGKYFALHILLYTETAASTFGRSAETLGSAVYL